MFNTKFDTLKGCMDLNKMTEKELVIHLKRYLDNQNYRSKYNKAKNALNSDPRVQAIKAEIKAGLAK